MIRIVNIRKETSIKLYDKYDIFEKENGYYNNIEKILSSIFLISQNIPKRSVGDFFNNEDFSLVECYHELNTSRELLKFGFFKQSMISLRIALDIGLMSIYWSIVGIENEEFELWIKSKKNTPRKDKKFWNTIKSVKYIKEYVDNSEIIDNLNNIDIDNYVHTAGMYYSNYRNENLINNNLKLIYNKWYKTLIKITKIIEALHLLLYPTLNIRYSTDVLLKKFGVYEKIPIMGCGFGDEMLTVPAALDELEINKIKNIVKNDDEIISLKNWITSLPNLSEIELRNIIIKQQKNNIEHGSFKNWSEFYKENDERIDKEMYEEIKKWAIENNYYDIN